MLLIDDALMNELLEYFKDMNDLRMLENMIDISDEKDRNIRMLRDKHRKTPLKFYNILKENSRADNYTQESL